MAYKVEFKLPSRILGRSDISFVVKKEDRVLGTLKVSKGAVVWFPKNANRGHKGTWKQFDQLAREHLTTEEYR